MSRSSLLALSLPVLLLLGALGPVAAGCGPYPYPHVSTTVIVEWDPDALTLERQVEDSEIILAGKIVGVDAARWNSPDGKAWSPSDEQTLSVLYVTFHVEPDGILKGVPEWGTPVALRVMRGLAGGDFPLSVGDQVVVFGLADGRYGGTYQPAEAYWLTNENNSIWIEEAGAYQNQGRTKDPAETNMSLEALQDRVTGLLKGGTGTTGTLAR